MMNNMGKLQIVASGVVLMGLIVTVHADTPKQTVNSNTSYLSMLFGSMGCKGFSRACLWNDLAYGVADVPYKLPEGVERSDEYDAKIGTNEPSALVGSMNALVFPNAITLAASLEPVADAICPGIHAEQELRQREVFPCIRDALYVLDDRLKLAVSGDASPEHVAFLYANRPTGRRLGAVLSSFVVTGVDEDHIRTTYAKLYPDAKLDPATKTLVLGTDGSQEVGWIIVTKTKDGYGQPAVLVFKGVASLADRQAQRDEMRVFLQEKWLKAEMDRLRVSTLDDVAEYHVQVAVKLVEKSPADVGRELAPLYLYSSQLSDTRLAAIDDARAKAAARLRVLQQEADKKAKLEAAAKEARDRKAAEQRQKDADAREAEWKRRQALLDAERKRLSDPKLVSRVALCRAFSDLDALYDARAYQASVEIESGVVDLAAKRVIGERIVATKNAITEWRPKFKQANSRDFDRTRDCAP
jgi:hypothetical protein